MNAWLLTAHIRGFHLRRINEADNANYAHKDADEEQRTDRPFGAALELQAENNGYRKKEDEPVGDNIDDAKGDNGFYHVSSGSARLALQHHSKSIK